MNVGQIIKINKSGLAQFAPAIRAKLEGQIGLVIQEKYDLSYKLDQVKLPEHIKVYPSLVRFDSLLGLNWLELDSVMVFPYEVEVIS